MIASRVGDGRLSAIGLAIVTGAVLSIRLNEPGWFDNEGRFAEAAREMLVLGDYVTPRVNFFPHLTKPPLTAWLAAAVYWITGPSEWGRLVSIAAAATTIFLTCRLGARLYDTRTGLVAGLMLATTIGFVLEARTLRPDCLVIVSVTAALTAWHVAENADDARRTRWLAAMWTSVGLGMLAKGFVPPVLAGIPIGIATVRAHGLAAGVRRLRPLLGIALIATIVLPWHVAAAIANPGFAWDYVVNEHIMFALGRKVPRDSTGDSLGFFWEAFAGRAAPWVLFLPLTLREAARGLGGGRTESATLLVWTWVGGIMLLFSLTPSRLEHYSLPALPAVALLAARACRRASVTGMSVGMTAGMALVGLVLLGGGVFGLFRGHALAAEAYWLPQAPDLMALLTPAAWATSGLGLLILVAAIARSANGVVAAGVGGTIPLLAIFVMALVQAEALFSWRPVARALARVPEDAEIVFQAPIEYQNIGGLLFYVQRPLTMLQPKDGFTPPAYLEPHVHDMFITRQEFDRRWQSGRPMVIVSDPQQRRDTVEGLVPPPLQVVDRFGDRWVLTNSSVVAGR